MKITTEIREALQNAVDSRGWGGQTKLGKDAGINPSYISRYLSEGVHEITLENWNRLKPFLDEYIDIEDIPSSPHNQNTKSLLKSFEKLDKNNQKTVVAYADDILQKQEIGRPEPLTQSQIKKSQELGIECFHGYELEINTKGLWWIYNIIDYERSYGVLLDNLYIAEILESNYPSEQFRDLHIQAFPIDTRDKDQYYQYAFYLDGTPPKLYTMLLDSTYGLTGRINLYQEINTPFKLNEFSDISIVFTQEEIDALKKGKTLKIT